MRIKLTNIAYHAENKSCAKNIQINAIEHKRFLLMSKDLFFNFFCNCMTASDHSRYCLRNTRIDLVG